jgi:uncharacterized membrane protein
VFSAIVFHCWTVFPGGSVGAACDIAHVIITIASAIKEAGMDLQCILTNAISDFLKLYISVSPLNGPLYLSRLFHVAEMRMAVSSSATRK